MTTVNETTAPDLVWGCSAIAEVIGRTERATFHLLKNQLLPAKRVGGRWCASRKKLIEALTGDGAAS
jgi:hypothetical protein